VSSRPLLSDAKRQLLEKMMRGGSRGQASPVAPRCANVIVPLSAGQRQNWLHSDMASRLRTVG
jgi:hypothetical protein